MKISSVFGKSQNKKDVEFICLWTIRFYELGRDEKKSALFHVAKCKRLDRSGIDITSIIPLTPKRFVIVELDLKELQLKIPTKHILITPAGRILTEVKWRRLNLETGLFEANLQFVDAARTEEMQDVFAQCMPSLAR